MSVGGLLARAPVVVGAVLVALASGPPAPGLLLPLAVGVVLALARPEPVGAWVALPGAVLLFALADDPGRGATLVAAGGLYLVHTGVAAAAAIPVAARVPAAVGRRWLLRCLPAVAVTTVVAGLDAAVGETPRNAAFAVVAVALVLLAAVLLARLLTRGARAGR